jgi:hypothetical protein
MSEATRMIAISRPCVVAVKNHGASKPRARATFSVSDGSGSLKKSQAIPNAKARSSAMQSPGRAPSLCVSGMGAAFYAGGLRFG